MQAFILEWCEKEEPRTDIRWKPLHFENSLHFGVEWIHQWVSSKDQVCILEGDRIQTCHSILKAFFILVGIKESHRLVDG